MLRCPTLRSSERREIKIHVNILSVRLIKASVRFLSIIKEVEITSPIRTKMFLIKECKLKFNYVNLIYKNLSLNFIM